MSWLLLMRLERGRRGLGVRDEGNGERSAALELIPSSCAGEPTGRS